MALFLLMATGLWILLYLDDCLLCALTKEQAIQSNLLYHIGELGHT